MAYRTAAPPATTWRHGLWMTRRNGITHHRDLGDVWPGSDPRMVIAAVLHGSEYRPQRRFRGSSRAQELGWRAQVLVSRKAPQLQP